MHRNDTDSLFLPQERGDGIRLWLFVGAGVWLAISYYLLSWAFWLSILVLIVYILYRLYHFVERAMTPHGKRIRHGMLKGHLEAEYGTREGGKLYKEMVTELRRKGYR